LSCPVLSCLVLSCLALPCLVFSCLVLSCLVLSCPALSCLALSCLVLSCLVLSCLVLSCLVLSCLVAVLGLSRLVFILAWSSCFVIRMDCLDSVLSSFLPLCVFLSFVSLSIPIRYIIPIRHIASCVLSCVRLSLSLVSVVF
jgi:hypothetical protein